MLEARPNLAVSFWLKALLLAALALQSSFAPAEETREIAWKDLLPGDPVESDDPFAELSQQQLQDLGKVARIRRLLEEKKIPADGYSAEEVKELVANLTREGIDVDWILTQRQRVAEQRQLRAEQVEESVDGKRIRIPGYMLPLESNDDGNVTTFLLVPWVGACIHTPPPPPNQMIHVTVPGGTESRGRFSPVWLEGTLELKPASYDLFLVDGSRNVNVAYTMTSDEVSKYSAAESSALSDVEVPSEALEGHNWFQRWQTKISILFTKTMTDIRDRKNSGPLFFGLLVAFLYGVVHTLGPGHGKAVVVSYFVGEGGSLSRGIRMGVLIAVFHVLSAVVIIGATHFLIQGVTGQTPSNYRLVKLISYGAIVTIGAVMLWKALRNRSQHSHLSHEEHDHEDHAHSHEECDLCDALQKKNKRTGDWLALAVGAVPCTGALLVLLFGFANNLLGSAVWLVVCISAGMALAMSGIGIIAILGRKSVEKRWNNDSKRLARFSSGTRIAGALLIIVIGIVMFVATLQLEPMPFA